MPVLGRGRNRQSSNDVAELDIEILTANMRDRKLILKNIFLQCYHYKYQTMSFRITTNPLHKSVDQIGD